MCRGGVQSQFHRQNGEVRATTAVPPFARFDHFGRAEIYSSLGHLGGGFEAVIGLHNTGRIDVAQMVTSRYTLADGLQAIEKSVEGSGSKVLVYPND